MFQKRSIEKKYQGFTMIELVLIIVIIGILAAAAIPRFADLKVQAQIAANQGFAGAMQSSLNVAHMAWIAAGAPSTVGVSTQVNLDGVNGVSVNWLGWRDFGQGITPSDSGCGLLFNALLMHQPQIVYWSYTSCTSWPCYRATPSGSVCTYTLQKGANGAESPLRTITYDLSTGSVKAN